MAKDRVFNFIFLRILKFANYYQRIDWSQLSLDGAFSPAIGGEEQVDCGYKGKGILMHVITDHEGMPLRAYNTAANGDERKQSHPHDSYTA